MIYVLFRWEIDSQHEKSFIEGWSELVHRNIEKHGALGSRLHKVKDNQWVSYSQWLSEEHFNAAQNLKDSHRRSSEKDVGGDHKRRAAYGYGIRSLTGHLKSLFA